MKNIKNEISILNIKNIEQSNNYNLKGLKKINFNLTLNLRTGDLFLKKPTTYKNLISPHKWLKYNEPEDHIKQIIKIYKNNFIHKDEKIFVLGITYKDKTFIENIDKKLIKKSYIIKPIKDLKLQKNIGVESIQDKLSKIKKIDFNFINKPNLIVARHIWEHFYDQSKFIELLKNISDDETVYYFEIPDCLKSIKNYDYSMLWEEHIHYYLLNAFLKSLEKFDFEIIKHGRFNYPYEDVLYAFFKKKKNVTKKLFGKKIILDLKQIIRYGKQFKKFKKNMTKKIIQIKKNGNIGIIGASHMAHSIISFFDLDKYIDYVYDGNTNKIGKYYFRKRLKIKSINEAFNDDCKNFIIAVNPMHKKFLNNLKVKLKNKNKNFFLIFANDPSSIFIK